MRVEDAQPITLEENWLFRLRRERFRSRSSGKVHDYYVFHLADAVNVIALTPDRQVVLVRQFRAGSARDSLETPGGLLEPGEDPLAAGARELLEETGYAGDPPELLGTVWSNPSILTSRTTMIVIRNARLVAEPHLDHGEEVTVELTPEGALARMMADGRIDHSLVVCAILWWMESRFPGQMAKAPRSKPITIWRIMVGITAVALVLGLILNLASNNGGPFGVVLIFAIVISTIVYSLSTLMYSERP